MKSKKGALQLTLEQISKLILLSVIIILVFIPLGTNLYSFYFPSIDKELKKSLNTLVTEAEDLKTDIEEHGATNPKITIPTYLKDDTRVMAYTSDSKIYESEQIKRKCNKESCLCIFQEKGGKELSACKIIKGIELSDTQLVIESGSTGVKNIEMVAEKRDNNIIIQIT